jgi:hypothetical protein
MVPIDELNALCLTNPVVPGAARRVKHLSLTFLDAFVIERGVLSSSSTQALVLQTI